MILQHPDAQQIQKELKSTKTNGPKRPDAPIFDQTMVHLLPSREYVDPFVDVYVKHFETTYRVLHLPSFWEEYTRLWETPNKARPGFICILLLMMAATNSVEDENGSSSRGASSATREMDCMWIEVCEIWLGIQSQKHTTLSYLQAHVMLLIAKRNVQYKAKRSWTTAGTLMHFAVAMGLHRDINILHRQRAGRNDKKQTSAFDQEMRRRLWWTIADIELQSSIERGMPPTLPDLFVDCGYPANCDDEELHPEMAQRPRSQPTSCFTRTSFLHHMSSTFHLRQDLVALSNGSTRFSTHGTPLEYQRKVDRMLDESPEWEELPESKLASSLINLRMEQASILLNRVFSQSDDPSYPIGRWALSVAAIRTMNIHLDLFQSGSLIFTLFEPDILNAALTLAYCFMKASTNRRKPPQLP